MTPETIFSIVNTVALLTWIFLAVLPRWRWTQIIVNDVIIILLSVTYLVVVVAYFGRAEGGFDSLANVMKLFSYKEVVLAGWIHYLAFDLFVGSWEVRDAQEKGVSHWFVLPCLFLTFMLGPIGLLLYCGIRLVAARKTPRGETQQ